MSEHKYINALDSVFVTVFSVVFGLYFGIINKIETVFETKYFIDNYGLIILFFVYIVTMFTGYIYIIDVRETILAKRYRDSEEKKGKNFSHFSIVSTLLTLIVLQSIHRFDYAKFNFITFYMLTLGIWFLVSVIVSVVIAKTKAN